MWLVVRPTKKLRPKPKKTSLIERVRESKKRKDELRKKKLNTKKRKKIELRKKSVARKMMLDVSEMPKKKNNEKRKLLGWLMSVRKEVVNKKIEHPGHLELLIAQVVLVLVVANICLLLDVAKVVAAALTTVGAAAIALMTVAAAAAVALGEIVVAILAVVDTKVDLEGMDVGLVEAVTVIVTVVVETVVLAMEVILVTEEIADGGNSRWRR